MDIINQLLLITTFCHVTSPVLLQQFFEFHLINLFFIFWHTVQVPVYVDEVSGVNGVAVSTVDGSLAVCSESMELDS